MANEYYKILGVSSNASFEDIKKGYFSVVRNNPPEKKPEQFKQIQEAYNILKDEETRERYDLKLKSNERIRQLKKQHAIKTKSSSSKSYIILKPFVYIEKLNASDEELDFDGKLEVIDYISMAIKNVFTKNAPDFFVIDESIFPTTLPMENDNSMKIIQLIRSLKSITGTGYININDSLLEYPSDFIIVSYLQGFTRSGGNIAKKMASSFLVGALTLGLYVRIPVISSFYLHIAIIDKVSKNVIYHCNIQLSSNPRSSSKINSAVKRILKKFFKKKKK